MSAFIFNTRWSSRFLQLKHAKKTQEQILAAEKREAELQKERMDRQQQNVQEKLQQQKELIMKQQVGEKWLK